MAKAGPGMGLRDGTAREIGIGRHPLAAHAQAFRREAKIGMNHALTESS